MTKTNNLKARDDLQHAVGNLDGVVSVGLGKEDSRPVLVVAIDSDHFEGGVPERFGGLDVRLRDLGKAVLQMSGSPRG